MALCHGEAGTSDQRLLVAEKDHSYILYEWSFERSEKDIYYYYNIYEQ